MRLRKSTDKKFFFNRLMTSYILLLLIPLLLSSFIFYKMSTKIKKDALEANLNLLEQTSQIIDQGFKEIEVFHLSVAMDNNLNWLLNNKQPVQLSDQYALWESMQTIKMYNISTNFIMNYYIIYPNSDVVLSSGSIYKLSSFYGNIYKNERMKYDEWATTVLNKYHKKDVLPATPTLINGDIKQAIIYLGSMPLEYSSKSLGTIMILISEDEILKSLEAINTEGGGNIYIIDANGEIIASKYKSDKAEIPEYVLKDRGKGYSQINLDQKKMLVSYTTSMLNEWTFVAVSPVNTVLAGVNYIKLLIFIFLGICLLLGMLFSYIMAYKNAKPLRDIVRIVKLKTNMSPFESTDEYKYLQSALLTLIDNNTVFSDQLQKHIPLMQAEFVSKLIKGELCSDEEIQSSMLQAELCIKGKFYNVILVHIEGYNGLLSLEMLKQLNILKLILKNAYMKTEKDGIKAFPVEIDEATVGFLISYEYEKHEECEFHFKDLDMKVQKFLEKEYPVDITVTIGNLYDNLLDIYYSYSQVRELLEHDQYVRYGEISWHNGAKVSGVLYYYPIEFELRLINLVKSGNKDEVTKLLQIIFKENFVQNRITIDMAKNLFNEFKGTIFKISEQLSEIKSTLAYNVYCTNIDINKLKQHDDVENFYCKLIEIFIDLCGIYDIKKNSSFLEMKQDLVKYINDNYTDQQLSLSNVASKFNFSDTNLSHFFKEQIGENFSDYLERLRIDKACELILTGNLSIDKISEKTGYSSSNSFRRAFKRSKGVAPSDFKKFQ